MSTTLVTGATGFLGQHLVNRLTADKVEAVVCLLHDRQLPAWDTGSTPIVTGDVCDLAFMRRVLSRYEVQTVYHLAAQTQVGIGYSDPPATFDTNVRGTWAVLEACRLEKAARIVVASSDKVYGAGEMLTEEQTRFDHKTHDTVYSLTPLRPGCPYSTSKACADMVAQSFLANYGMSIAITRCGNLYGPGDTNWRRLIPYACRQAVRGEPIVLRSDGRPIRDYLYISDAVEAYVQLAAAMNPDPRSNKKLIGPLCGPFNFSGGEPIKARTVANWIREDAGSKKQLVVNAEAVPNLAIQTLNCDKAKRMLGWKPQVALKDGLRKTLEWYGSYCR